MTLQLRGGPEIHIFRDPDGLYRISSWRGAARLAHGASVSSATRLPSGELRRRRFHTIEELQAAVVQEVSRR